MAARTDEPPALRPAAASMHEKCGEPTTRNALDCDSTAKLRRSQWRSVGACIAATRADAPGCCVPCRGSRGHGKAPPAAPDRVRGRLMACSAVAGGSMEAAVAGRGCKRETTRRWHRNFSVTFPTGGRRGSLRSLTLANTCCRDTWGPRLASATAGVASPEHARTNAHDLPRSSPVPG